MGQNHELKIMELFYEYPNREFTIREISKISRVPRATVHNCLKNLKKQGLVNKENMAEKSLFFKIKKINYFLEKLAISGLIEELIKELNPSCIILFGSIRKGDSEKESDIDLFIETHISKKVKLEKYERKLGHKIQLFIETDIDNLQPNLFNNVVNGIKIYGSFKIK